MSPLPDLSGPAPGTPVTKSAFEQVIEQEFEAWRSPLLADRETASPAPDAPGGLPEGWMLTDRARNLTDEVVLARRERGGWVVVNIHGSRMRSLGLSGVTLTEMYEKTVMMMTMFARPYNAVEQALRPALARLYDTTDPIERVEGMMFTLGGPLQVVPKADQPWGENLLS